MLPRIVSKTEIAQFNLLLVLSGTFFDIMNPDAWMVQTYDHRRWTE